MKTARKTSRLKPGKRRAESKREALRMGLAYAIFAGQDVRPILKSAGLGDVTCGELADRLLLNR